MPVAFTVEDLTDLIAILEQRPEWRERLRQILLTKELLELPQFVKRIAKAVDELEQEALLQEQKSLTKFTTKRKPSMSSL